MNAILLTPEEILDLHGGRIPETVREKIQPMADSVLDGTFSDRRSTDYPLAEKACSLVLEGKATVSRLSYSLDIGGISTTTLDIQYYGYPF